MTHDTKLLAAHFGRRVASAETTVALAKAIASAVCVYTDGVAVADAVHSVRNVTLGYFGVHSSAATVAAAAAASHTPPHTSPARASTARLSHLDG